MGRVLILLGSVALLGGIGRLAWSEPPSAILVDDFETGKTSGLFGERKNRLDAFQGTWARRPSYTVITKVVDTRPSSVGYALRIEYAKLGGWCGWYTLLNGIDISRHNALSFWVKGERGGERFDVGLADDRMQDLQIDAVYVGPIMAFLQKGVTTDWQQVKIPLQSLRADLNLSRMGSLVLWFRYEGAGAIQMDDVAFVYDEEVERIQRENAPAAKADPRAPRATWIWKYDPVSNPEARRELFALSERTAMRRYYLYLGEDPIPETPASYQKELAEFLRQCHDRGIEVQALQGNPLWALKTFHPRVLAWIDGFLQFNRARPAEERMDGVHLDIEPYLTQEWETGDRAKLQAEFIELIAQCRSLIDGDSPKRDTLEHLPPGTLPKRPWAVGPTAGKPFVMGLAIPIFYNREPEMEEKLLKHLDYAALMDYYDSARDIVDNGRSHVEMANRLKVAMVVGVETQDLVQMNQGKRRNTFVEEGWEEMERELTQVVDAFAGQPGFDGLAIHAYDSYRILPRGRNVPTRERTGKVPPIAAQVRAGPVELDGVLADWSGVHWLKVDAKANVVYGAGAWNWAQDLSYQAAFAWEPKALLLALDVRDDAHLQEKRGADMWEGDHVELWLDADLFGDYREAVNSADDFQLGLSPGNFKDLPPEVHVWVPSVRPETLKEIRVAAREKENGYTMEVRIPTAFLFQNVAKRIGVDPRKIELPKGATLQQMALQRDVLESGQLKPGFRLGVLVDGSDCDAAHQPQKCLLSSSTERQWGDPTTFNLLELK